MKSFIAFLNLFIFTYWVVRVVVSIHVNKILSIFIICISHTLRERVFTIFSIRFKFVYFV